MGTYSEISHWEEKMNLEIVSFYSDVDGNSYYSDHAKRLIQECETLGLKYDIKEKPSEGTYQKNCLSKPKYILDKIFEKRKPFVWLDIDSYLFKQPDVFDSMPSQFDLGFATSIPSLGGVKASPIFVNVTENAQKFIETWAYNANKTIVENQKHFDHEPLFALIQHFQPSMKLGYVGAEYCAWPKAQNENTVIMMGLSDVESKKENLRAMGMSEGKIEWQSVGTI